jgi:hypothetical protein
MQTHNFARARKFFWLIIVAALLLNGQQLLSTTVDEDPGDLIINEFVAENHSGLVDEDGDYSDWIEIYNPGRRAVNLAGWSLTDNPAQPEKWTFPDLGLGSHEYLLVFASGKDRKSTLSGAELHTNFKLNQEGEFLGLYNVFYDRFVDIASPLPHSSPPLGGTEGGGAAGQEFPPQLRDVAYGRYSPPSDDAAGELAFGYLANPTPGQPNDEASLWLDLVTPVHFSWERGFCDTPFTLELATTTPEATIRYTTDGSEPTETYGTIYTGPLTIDTTTLLRAAAFKPNFRSSPIDTHTYIFLDDVLTQPKDPPGFPRTWGAYQGSPVIADYEMDPEVVNDPRYRDIVEEALKSIPTISIVTDRQSFYDLYANPKRRGRAWERPVSVELIDPQGEQPGFQINAGLRMQGELGRSAFMPKHAFRLFFRGDYGVSKLEYPLFPDSPVEEFDTLVLRSGVNRSYAGFPERKQDLKATTYTRDEWLRASQIAMSGSGSHGSFVHLYLNGLYWGLYNVVERPDDAFMASYFGGAKDDWQFISHQETLSNSSDRFKTLHKLADDGQLEDPEKYAAIASYLDIPHFIDYLILNWYAGNLDWGFNNWYAGVQNTSGPVRYFVWDGERIWYEGADIYMDLDEYNDRPNLVKPLFEALLKNPDFKLALADRMYKHLFNDGALAEANAQARWLSINKTIERAIIGESARWGDTRYDKPLTQADWFEARDDVWAQMAGNAAKLIALAREAGYYPDLDPPLFNRHGGQIVPGFSLSMALPSPEGGTIYYTTDGSDPRLQVTGTVAPTANIYRAPLVLTATTDIKARVLKGDTWSALNEAVFRADEQANGHLQITEIMYHPLGGDDYEFIELKNTGNADLDLANIAFEGIHFKFPASLTPLSPGELIVLVKNPAAFARRYPDVPIGGVYEGQLSNKGEKISLKDANGQVITSLEYDDEHGWPVSPDGQGDSLVLINPQDSHHPQSWRASANLHGSPGVDEPILYP